MTTLLKLFIVGFFLFLILAVANVQPVPLAAAMNPARPEITPPMPDRGIDMAPTRPRPKVIKARVFKTFKVTAYCPCTICCGRKACGLAADGSNVIGKQLVAADWSIVKKHTMLRIPGYNGGEKVKVRDTGSAIKGYRLDVYFDDHQTAKEWGVKMLKVEIIN